MLIGLILGDVGLTRVGTENASLKCEQSVIHKEYLEHLFDRLKYLCTPSREIKTSHRVTKGTPTSSVYFTTRQLRAITELYIMFYVEGIKIIPLNIASLLTEESLAY